jgi:signal peptidase
MNINASNNDGMPSLFGRSYLSVQSDSMKKPYSYSNPYLQTTNTKARKGVNYYKFELITLPEGTDTPEDTYTHDYGQFFEYLGTKLGDKTYYKKVKVDIKSGSKIDERLYTTYEDEYSSYEIKNFKKGDMLVDKTLSNSEKKNLKVGDVITFWDETLMPGQVKGLNSHRIVYINEEGDYYLMGDFTLGTTYKDYGRYSEAIDGQESEHNWYTGHKDDGSDLSVDIIRVNEQKELDLIKGKVVDVWSGFGKTYDNIMNNMALYFMVFVFPVILLFLISMIFVILNIRKLVISKKKASAEPIMTEDEMKQSLEAERERMRQEILAELKKEQEMNQKSEEDKEEK